MTIIIESLHDRCRKVATAEDNAELTNVSEGKYSVYISTRRDYIGMTDDFTTHALHWANNGRVIDVVAHGLINKLARGVKQVLIERCGGPSGLPHNEARKPT